jgi:hypothetical protein
MAISSQRLQEGAGSVVLQFPGPAVHRPRTTSARRAAARRRVVLRRVVLVVALAGMLALVLLGGGGGGTAQASHSQAPRAVVIRSGQTLWDLARHYAPASMDPREYVAAVLELNHLPAPPEAGVRVRLPR